ncbi:hypothetical protein PFICI_03435 [Pestalotiopsis fici W106-1]|uniref:NmrA-like domain-containing protein n=1 Tax=Pestalotiopsis fici (strain W106-1 / CGMCC3.15140) TaxID=1229662 RepID=W3XH98_PESFW|nr:uncharacterized protein PFICI_03435 [Pestalotiopsis fici W106-1]ETS85410.1 hypothetical protein PFICI_03435 [Pestalotiopsis fici W106-1]
MAPGNIIIFGPTGQVAVAAARMAQDRGAKVSLAMRDTTKPIVGLDPKQEQSAGMERVYADLTLPDTVRAAVAQTGAKRAFLYCIMGKSMRPSIEALKEAGIELVVFNSSSTIQGDPQAVDMAANFIAWAHAQVEIALEEVFGVPSYVVVRPSAFMSNILAWKEMVKKGQLKLVYPEAAVFNYIAPEDIGAVCGALLAQGPEVLETKAGRNVVYLYGPSRMSQREAGQEIGRAIDIDLSIQALSDKEGVQFFVENLHVPEQAATNFVNRMREMSEKGRNQHKRAPEILEEAIGNIERYSGRPPTTMAKWLEGQTEHFRA